MKRLTVLGATGSIGASTLDVVARHPDRFQVEALTGNSRVELLAELCVRHCARLAVVPEAAQADRLARLLAGLGASTEVQWGPAALEAAATLPRVDTVMAAIVGAAGLAPTLAAVRAGKRVLLANKEALVTAGGLFMGEVARCGATLLPIDSEHNAIFQSLPESFKGNLAAKGVRRILLTASGGPFRETPLARLATVTPDEACAHPNWVMGRKISVDSATMMNKGLEVIEARWLFDARPEDIQVVIHPQSIVHSLVSYVDGSVIAELGNPDMRTPIAHALAYPERIEAGVPPLDLFGVGQLDFHRPDPRRFPCLDLAYQALAAGGAAPAVLNATNEEAVAAFLDGRLAFNGIAAVNDAVLTLVTGSADSLDSIADADRRARIAARGEIHRRAP